MDVLDQRDDPVNPFDEDALGFQVSKEINVAQLRAEIMEDLGLERVMISAQSTREPGISAIFITPAQNEEAYERLIEAHVANPRWGTELEAEFYPALEKVRAGKTLTTKEISVVLRVLLATT
jgi:hypothetical protein